MCAMRRIGVLPVNPIMCITNSIDNGKRPYNGLTARYISEFGFTGRAKPARRFWMAALDPQSLPPIPRYLSRSSAAVSRLSCPLRAGERISQQRWLRLTVLLPAHKVYTLLYRSNHERRCRRSLLRHCPCPFTQRLADLLRRERGKSGRLSSRWGRKLPDRLEYILVELTPSIQLHTFA